jgi:YVTN family beta-propeller protein
MCVHESLWPRSNSSYVLRGLLERPYNRSILAIFYDVAASLRFPMKIKIGRSCRGNFRRARSFLAVGGIVFAAVIPSLVRAQTVTATVSVGTVPLAVAVDPVTNAIYVSNEGSNNVTVINGATNNVTAAVSAGTQPYAVAINSVTNTIYVANYNSATVTVIDGATNTVTATVAVGTNPQLLQFH